MSPVSAPVRYWFNVPAVSPSVSDLSPLRSRYDPSTRTYTRVIRSTVPVRLFPAGDPTPVLDPIEEDSESDHGTIDNDEFRRYTILCRTIARRVHQFPWLVRDDENIRK